MQLELCKWSNARPLNVQIDIDGNAQVAESAEIQSLMWEKGEVEPDRRDLKHVDNIIKLKKDIPVDIS